MSGIVPRRRWPERAVRRVVVAVVVLVTAAVLGLVTGNSRSLNRVTSEVQAAQAQSANVSNATREMAVLLQMVTELGTSRNVEQVDTQRGLVVRHVSVSIPSFPAGSPQIAELEEIREALERFPWQRLSDRGGYDQALQMAAVNLVSFNERRINLLRTEEGKEFYSATVASLDANRKSQSGLSVLVAVVLALGVAGIGVVLRRSRSDMARAYDALRGEVDERRAAEEALRASEGRFRSLVQRASDLTVVTDEAGVVAYVSPAVEALLGYLPADLLDRSLLDHVEAGERVAVAQALTLLAEVPGLVETIQLRLRTRDGRVRSVEAVCQNLMNDPDVRGLVWNGRDVTDRRTLEDELSRQAHHDPLTGLPNRLLLLTRLGAALRAAPSTSTCISVILVDLDGFKNVNDTLGHPVGDDLLRTAAQRLLGCVREGDTAARLGGDEFAVLVSGPSPQAVAIGTRMVEVLRQPFTVGGHDVRVGASIGVAHRLDSESAEDLLRDADIAMYVAKNTGKGRLEVFEPEMRTRTSHRTGLQQQLARAVDLREIEVHYQPIIDLRTFRPTALEALARWRRPDRSLVPADVFIPIAEESGAILEIGQEVLRQACQATQYWRQTMPGQAELRIAVNVSVHQVLSGRLMDQVVAALRVSGLPATALTLEIIESTALEDSVRVAAEFARLQAFGVRIAVDDFGAGYSSLGFLLGLNADSLKIDRTLLDFDTTRQGSLVTAIAELGRTLGLEVVVEGVETPQHLMRAREAACDAAQGFHFSRPLTFGDVADFLDGWARQGATGRSAGVPAAAERGRPVPVSRAGPGARRPRGG